MCAYTDQANRCNNASKRPVFDGVDGQLIHHSGHSGSIHSASHLKEEVAEPSRDQDITDSAERKTCCKDPPRIDMGKDRIVVEFDPNRTMCQRNIVDDRDGQSVHLGSRYTGASDARNDENGNGNTDVVVLAA
jgi:hypothetical protein